jgi:hypothetical protein
MSQQNEKREFVKVWDKPEGYAFYGLLEGVEAHLNEEHKVIGLTVVLHCTKGRNADKWAGHEFDLVTFDKDDKPVYHPLDSGKQLWDLWEGSPSPDPLKQIRTSLKNSTPGVQKMIMATWAHAINWATTPGENKPNCTKKGAWRKKLSKEFVYVPTLIKDGESYRRRQDKEKILVALRRKAYNGKTYTFCNFPRAKRHDPKEQGQGGGSAPAAPATPSFDVETVLKLKELGCSVEDIKSLAHLGLEKITSLMEGGFSIEEIKALFS